MAVTFTTTKNTNLETVIHFTSSAAESGTIALNSLAAPTQALTVGGTPKVDIVKFVCTGELGSKVAIVRNGANVIVGSPENDISIEFNTMGIPVNNDDTADIVVTNGVAKAVTGWLVLRKVSGWSTKVETEQFGSYDNTTQVGA